MGSRYWSLGSPHAGTEENNQGPLGCVHQTMDIVGRLQCISPSAENVSTVHRSGFNTGRSQSSRRTRIWWAVFTASAHQQRTGSGFNPGRSQDSRRSHYTSQTVLKDSHGIGVQATRHGHAEQYGVIPGIKISVSNSRHHANRRFHS
uniref:Uncharacterized protein n=1 Tax=Oryza rufipogon TaxID=4529 RepID=A0A0E0QHV1_ORYRU